MSDIDKWRQRALRLELMLDSWGIFPQKVVDMSTKDIMVALDNHFGTTVSQEPAPAEPTAAAAATEVGEDA